MEINRLIRWPNKIWRRIHSRSLILLYHRVTNLQTDPQLLSVAPNHFADQLEYLSDHYNPISLSELYLAVKTGKIPDRSVVITFDDGYADNLWNAKPLLEKYDIPATVFVTSGYVGTEREFWWDDLERVLLLPKKLPHHLELSIKEKVKTWDLSDTMNHKKQDIEGIKPENWNVTMKVDPGPQYTIYRDLHQILKPLPRDLQESLLSTIVQWAGLSNQGRPTHRILNLVELKNLEKGGLIEIGAHTVTHTMLSMQPKDVQKKEILTSKQFLEQILGHQIQNFSYPFGGMVDFNKNTVELVKKVDFNSACTTYGGTVLRYADPYRFPRVLIRDWDISLFSSKMKEWFND